MIQSSSQFVLDTWHGVKLSYHSKTYKHSHDAMLVNMHSVMQVLIIKGLKQYSVHYNYKHLYLDHYTLKSA